MLIGKQLFGYKCEEVDHFRLEQNRQREQQLAELDQRLAECRSNITELLSRTEKMIIELDTYHNRDRSIANRVWEQVRVLEEVRHQTGLQIKEAVNLTEGKVERLQQFYDLLDRTRFKIGDLSTELAEAGRFGSPDQINSQLKNVIRERGTQVEV